MEETSRPGDIRALRALMELTLREIREIAEDVRSLQRGCDRLLTPEEAATLLGCSRSKVYAMIKAGKLPAKREESGRLRLTLSQVSEYIRS